MVALSNKRWRQHRFKIYAARQLNEYFTFREPSTIRALAVVLKTVETYVEVSPFLLVIEYLDKLSLPVATCLKFNKLQETTAAPK